MDPWMVIPAETHLGITMGSVGIEWIILWEHGNYSGINGTIIVVYNGNIRVQNGNIVVNNEKTKWLVMGIWGVP